MAGKMNDYHAIRNTAREAFRQSGLKYENLSRGNLQRLRNIINAKMKKGKFIRGSLRCHTRPFFQNDCGELYAGIKCKAYYFRDREAVTFNGDGFIAFAGWADNKNIVPIVEGFVEWVKEMAGGANE